MLVINQSITIPESEYWFTYARSGGPGGQNVNKVNSKATLHWNARDSRSLPDDVRHRLLSRYKNRISNDGVLLITSQRYRDQPQNASDCRDKLVGMIREVLTPPKTRRPTRPTLGSKRRRLQAKKLRSAKKETRRGPRADSYDK